MPKEIRIVKYLLTIEDPEERLSVLHDAFTPGEELEGKDVDNLYTYVFLVKSSCYYSVIYLYYWFMRICFVVVPFLTLGVSLLVV